MTTHDPIIEIEDRALRAAEDQAAKLMSEARTRLAFQHDSKGVFFASLMVKLEVEPCWSIETACTDGRRIKYNPSFICGLTRDEVLFVNTHEIGHCFLGHMARLGQKELQRANIAMDLSLNHLLVENKIGTMPKGGCLPGVGPYAKMPKGLSFEEYYRLLPNSPQGRSGDPQGKGNDPGGCGGVEAPGDGSEAERAASDGEWQVNVAQARNVAQMRCGNLPADLERLVGSILESRVPWADVLRDFLTKKARIEYKWSPPNRRYVHHGIYLPRLGGRTLGELVLAVDTSGSTGAEDLATFAGEIEGILELTPAKLTILYHDTRVANVQEWEPQDGELSLAFKGGGGTDHRPMFTWIDKHMEAEPAALICLTDCCTEWPTRSPEYPVIICSTIKGASVPFGELLYIGE